MDAVRSAVTRRQAVGLMGAAVAAEMASRLTAAAQEATPVTGGPGTLRVSLGSFTQVHDLTHTITPEFPVFPGDPELIIEPLRTYEEHEYYANKLTFGEHIGTHMDAPAHFTLSKAERSRTICQSSSSSRRWRSSTLASARLVTLTRK